MVVAGGGRTPGGDRHQHDRHVTPDDDLHPLFARRIKV